MTTVTPQCPHRGAKRPATASSKCALLTATKVSEAVERRRQRLHSPIAAHERGSSVGRHRRHFRGTAPLAAELHPWLRAIAEDLALRLDPARVIKRTGHDHRHVRHDL